MATRKIKTNKGAAKRFKLTKKRKVKMARCFRGHLLTGKSSKRKRKMGRSNYCFEAEAKTIRKLMPYS